MTVSGGAGWRVEARQREQAATPGPWEKVRPDDGLPEHPQVCASVGPLRPVTYETSAAVIAADSPGDLAFISHARTDLGRALDALDAVLALPEHRGVRPEPDLCDYERGRRDGWNAARARVVRAIEGEPHA